MRGSTDRRSRSTTKRIRWLVGTAIAGGVTFGVGGEALADVVGDPLGLVSVGLFGSNSDHAQVGVGIGGGSGNGRQVGIGIGGGDGNTTAYYDNEHSVLGLAVGGGNANGGYVSAAVLGGSANGKWSDTLIALALLGGNANGNTSSMFAFADSGCASSGTGIFFSIAVSLADACGASAQSMALGLRGADANAPIAVSDTGAATGHCYIGALACLLFTDVAVSGSGPASGGIAVSGTGPADYFSTQGRPVIAVSGTGPAYSAIAVSGTGTANGYSGGAPLVSGIAVSGADCAYGWEVAFGGSCASGGQAGVAGTGNADGGLVAVSGTGDANSGLIAVSGTGNATGPIAIDLD